MLFGVGEGVDSDDKFICPVLCEGVLVGLQAVVLHFGSVTFLFEVFLETKEGEGLVRLHHLAEQDGGVKLGSVNEHDLLLGFGETQRSPTNEFISEIYLY